MITIWKYTLQSVNYEFQLPLPKHARIKSLQVQFNDPTIWVCVDDKNELETRHFKFYATGQEIKEGYMNRNYIGTIRLDDGNFVYHLFEINPKAIVDYLA